MRAELPSNFSGPEVWFLCFYEKCIYPWLNRVIPGPYRHVNAIGHCRNAGIWLFYDVGWPKTRIFCAWDTPPTLDIIARWTQGATIVEFAPIEPSMLRIPLLFVCTPAIGHLVGLKGAVLPSTLYRKALKSGGRIILDRGRARSAAEQGLGTAAGAIEAG